MSTAVKQKAMTIAIAGNPNSGKTTLFNRLTGLRQKVANYPGVTVEKKVGLFAREGLSFQIIDLPGTYGLSPNSEDEKIASDVLTGRRPDMPPIEGVLCIVDSTCLERSLYLVLQILESGVPAAILLNMTDELEKLHMQIDAAGLSRRLRVPVIPISAKEGTGLDEVDKVLFEWSKNQRRSTQRPMERKPDLEEIRLHRKKSKEVCKAVIKRSDSAVSFSDRLDRIVLHKVWGPLIFAGVVLVVFQSIFTWAQPVMNLIDSAFGSLSRWILKIMPEGLLASFIADGVVTGVGSVIVFLPQILIVFFFIAVLENSGYLARAAMVMDRFMKGIGLQGKSFLPLISSYACAIPGIMAARVIENRRDRIATILIAPFMTCSARLPVYALLIGAFVPDQPVIKGILGMRALVLLGLYLAGFLAAVFTALILKSSAMKSDKTPFLLEIPPYRLPPLTTILLMMWERAKIFLRRAGTIILGVSIVLWFLVSFPRTPGPDQVRNSFAGQIGVLIEPVIKPLGFDWKIGVALLAAQAAREVVVSSLATIYSVGNNDSNLSLQEALKQDFTPLTAFSLLVFFVLAMQCMSTLAIAKRETGGWKMPAIMFLYMNAMAYMASLVVYQGGRLLGLG